MARISQSICGCRHARTMGIRGYPVFPVGRRRPSSRRRAASSASVRSLPTSACFLASIASAVLTSPKVARSRVHSQASVPQHAIRCHRQGRMHVQPVLAHVAQGPQSGDARLSGMVQFPCCPARNKTIGWGHIRSGCIPRVRQHRLPIHVFVRQQQPIRRLGR